QMQRVPFMVHVPGQEKGGISHTYGGEVDVLPTLLHLLGVPTDNYIQLGQDLLSNDHDQIVAFRNGSFMTPEYTFYNQTLYNNETQRPITLPDDEFETLQQKAQKQLDISDKINNGDLLRFHSGSGLTPIDPNDFDYKNQMEKMLKISETAEKDTSIFGENNNESTTDLYETKTYQEYHPEVAEQLEKEQEDKEKE